MKKEWPRTATQQQRAATTELLRRLHDIYPRRILSTILFGSVARGDNTPDSDIDVLIITDELSPDLKWDIWGVAARVSLDCDVLIDPRVYSCAHWERLRAAGRALWRNVEQEGIELPAEVIPA